MQPHVLLCAGLVVLIVTDAIQHVLVSLHPGCNTMYRGCPTCHGSGVTACILSPYLPSKPAAGVDRCCGPLLCARLFLLVMVPAVQPASNVTNFTFATSRRQYLLTYWLLLLAAMLPLLLCCAGLVLLVMAAAIQPASWTLCPGNKQNAVPHPDAAAVGCHAASYTAFLQQAFDSCIILCRAGATRHCSSDAACLVSPLLWQQADDSASSCSGSFS